MNTKTEKPEENKYDPALIEKKYQDLWEEKGVYEPDLSRRPDGVGIPTEASGKSAPKPFYNLMMFPYPSAEGLHIGNLYAFTGADIFGRMKRMQGFAVFEPIGLDGFGIHSENYALKVGEHPAKVAKRTQENFYRQLRASGNSYAWKHTLETYDPNYYKWTQWIFVQMFKAGLAYKKDAPVNWCPGCKTVLADEQVLQKLKIKNEKLKIEGEIRSGVCERCGTEVEVRKLKQWFFRITNYAEKLLSNLKKLNWPKKVLLGQKNWIGESKGAEIIFKVEGKDLRIKVFTTRLDTIYGVTAIVIAPDKKGKGDTPLALELAAEEQKTAVKQYLQIIRNTKYEIQNTKTEDEKTGVFTGTYAVNPFSGEKIPIWVANYVIGWYGTGALMVVPAHDVRDFEFAKKYKLPVRPVVRITHKAKAIVLKKSVGLQFIDEIRKLKIPITISKSENFQIELKPVQIDDFIALVKKYLLKNYWVEIIGARTIFIFGDGEMVEIKDLANEERVLKKCQVLEKNLPAGRQVSGSAFDLWDMLTEVEWYKDVITTDEYGVLINSGEYTGLSSKEAISKMVAFLRDTNCGGEQTQYKLRDWIISRQRYWGAPIPIVFCQNCAKNGESWFSSEEAKHALGNSKFKIQNSKLIENWKLSRRPYSVGIPTEASGKIGNSAAEAAAGWYPVPEKDLPVLLPQVSDWKPKGKGVSPLASIDEFVYTTCPNCGGVAERETDVCDTFLDSSWYYLRYPSVGYQKSKIKNQSDNAKLKNEKELPWDPQITRKWLPVSQYTGGAEHTVLHLLYSRFVTMALSDMGYLDFDEPFPNFYTHGLIIAQGAKMSKSKGNVVIPDGYINKYGVDTLRCYLMFLGPWEMGGDFRDSGMRGMFKFLRRVWNLAFDPQKKGETSTPELKVKLHKTIKKVTEDIVKFKYNTALAFLMEFVNSWEANGQGRTLSMEDIIAFLKLLAPFAPHMTEELFQRVSRESEVPRVPREEEVRDTFDTRGTFYSIHKEEWPEFDESLLVEEKVTIVVQVNGKLRGQIEVLRDFASDREQVIEEVFKSQVVKKYISDPLQAKKIIFVPGRLLNFVV